MKRGVKTAEKAVSSVGKENTVVKLVKSEAIEPNEVFLPDLVSIKEEKFENEEHEQQQNNVDPLNTYNILMEKYKDVEKENSQLKEKISKYEQIMDEQWRMIQRLKRK